MKKTIETRRLSKHYGALRAVEALDIQVNEGEIYALLGLNGAGKTTTIRMLLGMIRPTAGEASVLGQRVRLGSPEPWADVGYLMETPRAYPDLSLRENLEVSRRLHPGTPRAGIDEIITLFNLGEYAERKAGKLSLGNMQRLALARALLHRPQLLILDEPANGLDPAGIVEVRGLLRRLSRQDGVTIFMSSHILGEVARLAQRIGIIHEGRLLQELSITELERQRRRWLRVSTRDNQAAAAALSAGGFRVESGGPGVLRLADARAVAQPEEVSSRLVNAGHPPTELITVEEDLEAYFLRLIQAGEEERHD